MKIKHEYRRKIFFISWCFPCARIFFCRKFSRKPWMCDKTKSKNMHQRIFMFSTVATVPCCQKQNARVENTFTYLQMESNISRGKMFLPLEKHDFTIKLSLFVTVGHGLGYAFFNHAEFCKRRNRLGRNKACAIENFARISTHYNTLKLLFTHVNRSRWIRFQSHSEINVTLESYKTSLLFQRTNRTRLFSIIAVSFHLWFLLSEVHTFDRYHKITSFS